ncbi:hypothetical protein THH46_17860 [Pseudomonas sp. NA13]|uniref:Uncharacterized protein n=1 Tax=Pseudomonas brassicacearum TaxID=930166 RepID=A0AAJ3FUV4_9PSED|nr:MULTISPECIES: hypothetical protein [Pseudomonas]NUT81344.1 hypothetical protein [Pseudomonas brassicacearum]QGA50449.1 hypothetical protein GFU70_15340 [Pseudomonas brassicacearum]
MDERLALEDLVSLERTGFLGFTLPPLEETTVSDAAIMRGCIPSIYQCHRSLTRAVGRLR